MRTWAVSFGIAIQLLAVGTAFALDANRRVTQYAQTHFATHEGMPHSFANAIEQTADGYLWTTSQEGLSRFDGTSFTTYDHRTLDGIPINQFISLAVDRQGTLWAGTRSRGVLHVVGGEFRSVAWEPGTQEQQARVVKFDANGDLWIGMRDRGVVRLHDGVLAAALTTRDGLPSDDVRALLAGRDGVMWIGTFHGLVRWANGSLTRAPAPLDTVVVHSIAQDRDGVVWCATDKGLLRLKDGAVEAVGADRLVASDVARVLVDRDGNLWIGLRSGLARMTADGQIERLPSPDVAINALFEDADGNLWIASDKGLDRLSDGDVLPFGASEGLADEVVGGFREDATGAKWITTPGGLYRIAPGEMTATRIAAHRGLFAIYDDSRGNVWFGDRAGNLGRWRDGQVTWQGNQNWERIRSLAETAEGLWVGTEHGLFHMGSDTVADATAEVPGVSVRSIVAEPDGSLWLGTEDAGLMHWRARTMLPIPPGGPPRTILVTTLRLDSDGTMWVGTEGGGLWRLRNGHWFAFTGKQGMFDDTMWRILDDGLGYLWMSSNRGIWRVSRQQLDAVAAGQRATVESLAYGEADGMRDRECNGVAEPAGWRTGDGRLWFPTGKGLVVIDPAHLHERKPPRALIESVLVNGRSQPLGPLVLPPGSSRLEIGYTSPALRGTERLRFRYRLEGFEPNWNEARMQRIAQYTNLPPGEYRFVVEAGIDEKWGPQGVLSMSLPPLFYQTRWFDVLAVLSLALAIVAVPLLRVRQLRRRARELDARVQQAIGELKVLSGLLPMCAWCKKIRDDHGYWSKIEAYLSARTDAEFTHSICPDCTKKMIAEESFGRSSISQGPGTGPGPGPAAGS